MRILGIGLVVCLAIGGAATAAGPEWVVDDVTSSHVVCHQKFHSDHLKQVPVPAAGAPKRNSACPS